MITTIYGTLEKAKLWRQYKEQWLPGFGMGRRINGQNTADFKAAKILFDTILIGRCHYTFFQTHRMHKNKNKP